jgi:hypothetical protein
LAVPFEIYQVRLFVPNKYTGITAPISAFDRAIAEWRNHLAQVRAGLYKLRCGNLLSRVKYLFQLWAHMEVTDMAIETYCTQMSMSRRVKVVNKKQRNQMLAGHEGTLRSSASL